MQWEKQREDTPRSIPCANTVYRAQQTARSFTAHVTSLLVGRRLSIEAAIRSTSFHAANAGAFVSACIHHAQAVLSGPQGLRMMAFGLQAGGSTPLDSIHSWYFEDGRGTKIVIESCASFPCNPRCQRFSILEERPQSPQLPPPPPSPPPLPPCLDLPPLRCTGSSGRHRCGCRFIWSRHCLGPTDAALHCTPTATPVPAPSAPVPAPSVSPPAHMCDERLLWRPQRCLTAIQLDELSCRSSWFDAILHPDTHLRNRQHVLRLQASCGLQSQLCRCIRCCVRRC